MHLERGADADGQNAEIDKHRRRHIIILRALSSRGGKIQIIFIRPLCAQCAYYNIIIIIISLPTMCTVPMVSGYNSNILRDSGNGCIAPRGVDRAGNIQRTTDIECLVKRSRIFVCTIL